MDQGTLHVLPYGAVVRTLMTTLRNRRTPSDQFFLCAKKLGRLVAAEAVQEIELEGFTFRTPMEACEGYRFPRGRTGLVPVLRAGNALEGPFREILPNPRVWHVGISRDHKTLKPRQYSSSIPKRSVARRVDTVFVLDPMLATGGSAAHAIELIKVRHAPRVVFVGLVGAPEGVNLLKREHPDVPIYLASYEEGLTDNGYIERYAIGDFGDRFYNSL